MDVLSELERLERAFAAYRAGRGNDNTAWQVDRSDCMAAFPALLKLARAVSDFQRARMASGNSSEPSAESIIYLARCRNEEAAMLEALKAALR
jgi:hypothetical protein